MQILNPPIIKENITAIILAGGAGSRVSGKDKGLLDFQGKSLVSHQISKLEPQVKSILISANRNIESYKKLGYPILQDKVAGYPGPLHGVFQGLTFCKTPYLFVQPIDVPLLPDDLVIRFCQKISRCASSASSYYLKTSTREHYLCSMYCKNKVKEISDFLKTGNARVRDLHCSLHSVSIEIELSEALFKNLNYLNDYS